MATTKSNMTFEDVKELPFPLMQGYRIMRLCNRALYEVRDAKPDGVSRIEVNVVQLGIAKGEF
ncbi:hypothetical protein XH84_14040 [Bradyrhizobium nanningense]|nr:hypothetical protein XH84_14040 [Bradyrhizobium nanningense]